MQDLYYRTLKPSSELKDVVDHLWISEGYRPPHEYERVFPSGVVEIVINLMDGELRCYDDQCSNANIMQGPIISGMQRKSFVIDTRIQGAIMGAFLKPGGAWKLLGIPVGELAGSHFHLEMFLGDEVRRLMDILWSCNSHMKRLQALHDCLKNKLSKSTHPAVLWAAEQFRRYPDTTRIQYLADEAGLSMRRFNELFVREVGLNPKCYGRIQRFRATLHKIHQSQSLDWGQLAVEMGYSDQAHLIREFKEFSGVTPSVYRSQGSRFFETSELVEVGLMLPLTTATNSVTATAA